MNHAHQSITDIHLTPPRIIEVARNVMGHITLDPCTSEQINAWSVNATSFFDCDGIERLKNLPTSQSIKLWCNPPGGKTGNKSNMKLWLEAVYSAWLDGKVEQAFFLFFNREFIGGTETIDLSNIPMLHFYDRLKYWSYNEVEGKFMEGNWSGEGDKRKWTNSPTHPSTLAYFPPRTNSGWSDGLQRLEACTPSDLGRWVIPQIPSNLGAK